MEAVERRGIKVADEVWVAAALLHRENPSRDDFSIQEIVQRADRERLRGALRPGVYVHAVQHCVANRRPNPGRYRLLLETSRGMRRLYRPGDPYDPSREGGKSVPKRDEIPPAYRELIDWYFSTYTKGGKGKGMKKTEDPILALRGAGKHLATREHPDEHVRKLREGWE